MSWIMNFLVSALAVFLGAQVLKGVSINSYVQALVVVVVVALLDMTLGNVLRIVTLGILSLGIFNWLLNALLIQVADWFLPDFKVNNFWWALGLAAFISIGTCVVDVFLI